MSLMKNQMDTDEVQNLLIKKHEDRMLGNKDLDRGLQGHINFNIKTEIPSPANNGARNAETGTQIDSRVINVHVKKESKGDLYMEDYLSTGDSVFGIERVIKQEIPEYVRSQQEVPAKLEQEVNSYIPYYDIPIKEELININPRNFRIKNESVDDNVSEMIQMENGCTNSGCNSQKRCLHTYKCSQCNLVFTEKEVFADHFKKCRLNKTSVAVPSAAHKTYEFECSGQNLKKLIENVKTNPCLYNSDNEDYNDIQLKDVIWANIAVDCGFPSGTLAEAAWKKLKESFHDALAQQDNIPGHQRRKRTKRFKYQKQMEFLLPYVSTNVQDEKVITQTSSDHVAVATAEMNFVNEDAENDRSNMNQLLSPAKKQKLTPSAIETLGTTNANKRNREGRTQGWNQLREAKVRPSGSSQPLHMFFLSMCETTKNLPPHLQLQVKRRVFQAVIEAEEAAATMNNNCTNASSSFAEEPCVSTVGAFPVDAITTTIGNSSSSSQED